MTVAELSAFAPARHVTTVSAPGFSDVVLFAATTDALSMTGVAFEPIPEHFAWFVRRPCVLRVDGEFYDCVLFLRRVCDAPKAANTHALVCGEIVPTSIQQQHRNKDMLDQLKAALNIFLFLIAELDVDDTKTNKRQQWCLCC